MVGGYIDFVKLARERYVGFVKLSIKVQVSAQKEGSSFVCVCVCVYL
jgi:hypothetical protein